MAEVVSSQTVGYADVCRFVEKLGFETNVVEEVRITPTNVYVTAALRNEAGQKYLTLDEQGSRRLAKHVVEIPIRRNN
jgi:hypothetical protein